LSIRVISGPKRIGTVASDHEAEKLKQGWVGRLFGSDVTNARNIAGMTILGCFIVILIAIIFVPPAHWRELVGPSFALATGCVGFVFGRSSAGG
jgi:hypothetical protein